MCNDNNLQLKVFKEIAAKSAKSATTSHAVSKLLKRIMTKKLALTTSWTELGPGRKRVDGYVEFKSLPIAETMIGEYNT